jgi:hypothetical protein
LTESYDTKNAGTGKTLTVSTGYTVNDGNNGNNYTVTTATNTTGVINKAPLSITAASNTKTYDATTSAATTPTTSGLQGTDTVSGLTESYDTKNAGTGKTLTVSTGYTVNDGNNGNNYTVTTATNTTGVINKAPLSITAASNTKTYDATISAAATPTTSGLQGTDTVSGLTESYDTKNAGTGKTLSVNPGYTVNDGNSGGNYTVTTATNNTGVVQPRPLTISASGVNKQYDATTVATVTLADDRITSDVFTDSYAAAVFADKNVGLGKTVSVSGISITGADAANYTFNTTASTAANISPRPLTVSAMGANKQYDGTTAATVTLSDNHITGDILTDSYTGAAFVDKNAGMGKTVNVTGISISGTDAGNYTLSNTTASTTANISQRPLGVTATGVNKVYDGTSTATVTLSDNRISGDVFTDSYTSATFADKNVGTAKKITVTGVSITGTDASNYTFNATAYATADITARPLTITATGVNKVYDGTTAATVTLSDNRISGDVFTDSYTNATFADKNAASGKPVNVNGISISGADAANYTFNNTATTTADITARPLTVSAAGLNKVYDGTTAATVMLSDNRIMGDVFTDSYASAAFSDKNVGTAKKITVNSISISGTDAANYTFNATVYTTADITARPLTISATGINKVYDGGATATVTLSDNRVLGDALTDSYSSASFADKNAGTGKPVTVSRISISGTDASNYTFNATAATTADITARPLTVSATGVNKVYDGTTTATVTLSDNRVSGDVVTDSYTTATFANKNAGIGKMVSVSGISISGADAANYTFNSTTSATANITQAPLTVTATGANKVYDGTTTATVTLSDNHVFGDAVTDGYTTATFADKNIGTGKTVSVSGISIGGTDAGNYSLQNTTASATANITQAALTVTATAVNKVYDGTTTATVTLSDNRVSGDVFTDSYSTATFADKNVGNGKTVSVSGINISGADASNYTFNSTAMTTANISARSLTVGATGVNRVYDGTTSASVTLSDNRVAGDVFTDSYTNATFADKNVGTSKTVSLSGISISGADAPNYTFNTTATTTANISARSLTVTATGVNKVYDGMTSASVTLSDNRVAGDSLTDSYTGASFADKNVGTGKTVSVTGISISGGDAGNYSLQNTTVTTTANITQASLIITADNKTMLLNASLPAFTVSYSGFVNSEGPGVLGGSLSCSAGTNGTMIGTFTITCNGQTSTNYSITYKTGTVTVKYAGPGICDGDAGHQILQPINADGSSVFKATSTSPAKFRVCDANGISIGTAGVVSSFVLYQTISGTVANTINEAVASTTPDTNFRWDPTGQQWIFNISNKGSATNQTYIFLITLNDGTTIMFQYGLR